MSDDLVLLTNGASFNISFDEPSHSGPPIRTGDHFQSFLLSRMSGYNSVVMVLNYFTSEIFITGDITSSFIEKKSVV